MLALPPLPAGPPESWTNRMTDIADNTAQKTSKAFVLPAADSDFLLSDSMRGVRFMLEYSKAEQTLKAWGIRSDAGGVRLSPRS